MSAAPILLRNARIVPIGTPGTAGTTATEPTDLLLSGGRVTAVGEAATADGVPSATEVLDLAGRWVIPGLWDQHVHMSSWAQALQRIDVSGSVRPQDVVARIAAHLENLPEGDRPFAVTGWGYRSANWDDLPSVAELDAVSQGLPVVIYSGDGHSGWLNTAAQRLLGLEPTATSLDEDAWFAAFTKFTAIPEVAQEGEQGLGPAAREAAARGIVGLVDLEFDSSFGFWPARVARGVDELQIRTAVYPDRLDDLIALGRATGDPFEDTGDLVRMGPLKVITDGSLGTRTAHCCDPYPATLQGDFPHGKQNVPGPELEELLRTATGHGLDVAVHAIGDAAIEIALQAYAASGAQGSIEHAQLTTPAQLSRMATLGIRASVQPAHLLDDRDLTARCWPGREERCFAFRSMLDAGIPLVLGSDAPVAPLDPWLAIAAAVHRSADEREAWVPEQAITAAEALAASTDGAGTVAAGHRADLAVLDHDPLAPAEDTATVGRRLRAMTVALTVNGGRVTHSAL